MQNKIIRVKSKGRGEGSTLDTYMDSGVEQVKEKLPIQEVVGGYITLQRAGHNFRARCPFHKERTPSFMVSPERGTYMCFGCGERGDIFSFVQKMDGVDFPTALRQLAERAGVVLERRAPEKTSETKEREEKLREICEATAAFFIDELQKRKDILAYLRTRGVHDDTIASWRIGYAPASWRSLTDHLVVKGFSKNDIVDAGLAARLEKKPGDTEERVYDRFRGRIMFPIFDLTGGVIAFSGRFFEKVEGSREEGDPAKYVNSPETDLFKKSKVLYGLDRAKGFIRKADCILMVEGQFDLVLSHQSGLPFAVAVSGTALTQDHLNLLARFSKRLVLALDADEAGLRAGLKSAAMAIAAGFDVKIPTFNASKDPADLARENPELLRAAVRTSETAIEFFLSALRPGARDERAYKRLVETRVLPLIALLSSRIDQEHFIQIVAKQVGVSEDAVRAEVARKPALLQDDALGGEEEAKPPAVVVSSLSHALAMLQFYFEKDAAMQQKLKELVGEEKYAESLEKHLPEAEKFRFEFESLGGEREDVAEDLLLTIKRARVRDEIEQVSRTLHTQGAGQGELLQKLAALKRSEEELRN
jgi:DNA primase